MFVIDCPRTSWNWVHIDCAITLAKIDLPVPGGPTSRASSNRPWSSKAASMAVRTWAMTADCPTKWDRELGTASLTCLPWSFIRDSGLRQAWLIRFSRKKTGKPEARKDQSGTIFLQFFDVVPQNIRVSIKQGVMSSAAPPPAPARKIPMLPPIHDDESRKLHVDNLHFDLGFVPHDVT